MAVNILGNAARMDTVANDHDTRANDLDQAADGLIAAGQAAADQIMADAAAQAEKIRADAAGRAEEVRGQAEDQRDEATYWRNLAARERAAAPAAPAAPAVPQATPQPLNPAAWRSLVGHVVTVTYRSGHTHTGDLLEVADEWLAIKSGGDTYSPALTAIDSVIPYLDSPAATTSPTATLPDPQETPDGQL